MLWNTYEIEKHYERKSAELDRQWKLWQGDERTGGIFERGGKLIRKRKGRKAQTEKSEMPRTLGCCSSGSCGTAQA